MKVLVLETILERIRIDSDRHVRQPYPEYFRSWLDFSTACITSFI